jgi:trimeric autotransporter adhesin
MRRTARTLPLAGIFLLSIVLIVKGFVLQVPSGTWATQANLVQARADSSAVLLPDGRILVIGGNGTSGPVATSELFGVDGSISAAAPMNVARSNEVSVVLQGGRVLVAGGTVAGGGATNAAETYDPIADSWSSLAGGMTEARSGARAALLQDGRVVIAGGQSSGVASSTIEIFDPTSGAFTFAGALSSPRTQHAMAILADGRVMVIGGSNGSAPVASTDIYDPVAATVTPGPSLGVARYGHSATTLLDGRVLVTGGGNIITNPDGSTTPMDLATAEIFDPATGAFTMAASSLATARQGHLAFLLPHNNNVLIVGGTSAGIAVASSELFTPWQGTFSSTGSLSNARSNAAGSPMQQDGLLLVAGGNDASTPPNTLASTELYGFATVKTDQADYAPGTIVTITGSGWTPGETVTLTLVESPLIDTHGPFTVTADASGNISNSSFVTDSHDLNVKFILTAVGSASQAQTTFTDSQDTVTLAFTASTSGSVTNNQNANTCTWNGSSKSGTGCTITVNNGISVILTGSTNANWSITAGGGGWTLCSPSTSTTTCTVMTGGNNNGTVTATFLASTSTTVSSSANPSVFGQPVTFTATVSPSSATGTVTFKDGTTTLGTGVLSGGTATLTPASLAPGSHSITAVYGGDSAFSGSTSSTLTQTVNQASTTTSVSSSANLSVFGQSVTFTAAVSGVAPSTATVNTGTVQFVIDGVNFGSAVSVSGGTATSGATTTLSVGSHTITANYTDGTSYANSNGSLSGGQTVNQASTTTSVNSSANPSVSGQSVTFTATVNPVAPGSGTRTGTVQFAIDGNNFGSPVTLSGGTATSGATASLSQGTHTVTATYIGDTNFSGSNGTLSGGQTVNKAGSTTSVSSLPTTNTVYGESVAFTAAVSANSPGTGTPTGSVNFYDRASGATCTSLGTSTQIGTTQTLSGGSASVATPSLSVATHTVLACYLGDSNFNTSSGTASKTVGKASTSTAVALTSGANPSIFGASLTFTATVTVNSPGSGTPTGNVTFRSNGTTIMGCGTQSLNAGSPDTATCTTTSLALGSDTITATYNGDSNFSASPTSASIIQIVETLPNITSATSTNRFGVGGTVNCTGNNLTSLNCFTVTTTGSLPMTVAESPNPDLLPSSVTYVDNGNGTATLSGTPAANTNGTYHISFTATNAVGSNTQSFTFTVLPQPTSPSTPALTTADPDGVVQPNNTITVTGTVDSTDSNDTVKVFDGLTLVGSQIVGTCSPTCAYSISFNIGTTAGTHSITATATDSIGNVSPTSGGLVLTVPGAISPATIGTQTDDKGATTVTQTASVSVGSNASEMNTIIVTIAMQATTSTVTVSDSAGNTYTKDADINTGNIRTLVFSAPVTHALSSGTITVNFPSPTPADKAVSFLSVNGLVTAAAQSLSQCGGTLISGAEDKCSTNTGNSTAPSSSSTATTSQSDELLIGALGVLSQGVSYSSFGQGFQAVPSGFAQADAVLSIQPTYLVANATGTYAASGAENKTAPWAAAVVTYKIKFPTVSITTTNQDVGGITPASITFTATFSQPVLGVDAEDFALVSTGSVSGANIASVTSDPTGAVYTVTVNTGSGNGTIQLNYQDDNDTTVDANNIPLNGTVTPFVALNIPGPAYTVNKSVATTTTVSSSNNSPTYGTSVTFTAVVSPNSGTTTPTGTISFSIDGGVSVPGTNATCPGGSPANSFCAIYSTSSLTSTNGTPHTVSASFAHSGIFLDSSGALSGGQTVNQKTLTVTSVTASNKVYDGTNTATQNSCTLSGVLAGDTGNVTCSASTLNFSDKNVGTAKTVNVSGISLGGSAAGNYQLTSTTATTTANITGRAITVTATTNTKTYDGTTSAAVTPAITTGNLATGDTANFTEAYSDRNFGIGNKTLIPGGTVNDGNGGNNYTVTFVNFTTGTINKLAITVTAVTSTKTYDGNTSSAGVPMISPALISPDTSNFVETFDNRNAGTTKKLTPSGSANDGNGGNNYAPTFTPVMTGTITPLAITVTAVSDSKTYDGTNTSAGMPSISPALISPDTSNFTQTFDNRNAGTNKKLTPAGSVNDGNSGNNYAPTFTPVMTGTITPLAITVTAVTSTKTYDGNISSTGMATISPALISPDTSNFTQTFDNRNAGMNKKLTPEGSANDGNGGNNYKPTFVCVTAGEIDALAITVTAVTSTKTYDGATSSTGLPTISPALISPDTANFIETFDTRNAGMNKTLTPSGSANDGNSGKNYMPTFTPVNTGTIDQAPLTFTAVTNKKTYDATTTSSATPTVTGLQGSDTVAGLSETYDNKNVGMGKTLSVSAYTVNDGNGGNNYNVTKVTNTTGEIDQAPLTITAATNKKTYDATTTASATPTTSGLQGGDTVTGLVEVYDTKNVGMGKTLTVSAYTVNDGNGGGNYSVTTVADTTGVITALHITGSFTADGKVYDGNTSATVLSRSLNGAFNGDSVSLSGGTATFADKNVGNGKTVTLGGASLTGADAVNYVLDSVATTTANITPRTLHVSWTAANKVYDGTTATTATFSDDRVSGDVFTDTYIAAAFTDKNVGTGKTANVSGISISGMDAGNYTLNGVTTAATTADITARTLHVVATGLNKVYDTTTTAMVTLSDDRVVGDVLTDNDTSAAFTDKNAGNNKTVNVSGISISGADSGNYTLNGVTTATAAANIMPAPLTITAVTNKKTYDATTSAAAAPTVSGLQGGDTVSGLAEVYDTKNVGMGKTLTVSAYTVNDGNGGGNYKVTTATNATGEIDAAPLSITAVTNTKVYDGYISAAAVPTVSGLQGSDTVSGLAEIYDNKNVGMGKMLTVSAYSVNDGNSGNNYNVTLATNTTGVITTRPITVTADPETKIYGTTDPALTYKVTSGSLASGDAFSGGLARASGENVGTYAIQQGMLTAGNNYALTYVGATLTISKANTATTVTSSSNSSILNSSVTFTAKVVDNSTGSTGTPTGSVTFMDGTTTIGTGILNSSGVASYTTSTLAVNSHSITVVYGGDGNFLNSTSSVLTQLVTYMTGGTCDGDAGHQILQPINADGSSVWKQGSTVPAKFRVCNYNGNSIGTSGVVKNFFVYQTKSGTVASVDETNITSTNSLYWNFDPTGQQWIFNIGTKTGAVSSPNTTYYLEIDLNDGSSILFQFGLR